MKNYIFDTYKEALKAARNAMKDGYNTIIREGEINGSVVFVNEYFRTETERYTG